MRFQRLFCIGLVAISLNACAGSSFDRRRTITPDEIIEETGGPKVGSLESALKLSAQQATEKGEYLKASQFYQQLNERHPGNNVYTLALADTSRRSGQLTKALKLYEEIIRANPESLVAHEGRGLTLLGMGQITKATEVLEAVKSRDISHWRAINGLGIIQTMQDKHGDAIRTFRLALEQSPNNAAILNNLGLTLARLEDFPRAIKAMQTALRYVDSDKEVDRERIDMNLAMIYGLSGQMDQAEERLKRYLNQSQIYNNLGHYAYLANNKVLSQTYLDMALTTSKEHYQKAWDNLEQLKAARE